MMTRLLALALTTALAAPVLAGEVRQVPHGMVVTTDAGEQVRVLAYRDGTFRITVADELPDGRPTAMVVEDADGGPTFSQAGAVAYLVTPKGSAAVGLIDGRVTMFDPDGAVLLDEYAPARTITPVSIEGQSWLTTRVQFNRGTDEGLYGLGQHQNRQMNYNGEDLELAQHNMAITVRYLVSTKGYGLLWDNASITRVGDPEPYAKLALDWRAQYFLGNREVLDRAESTVDYQYLRDQARWPSEAKAAVEAATTGQNTQGNAVETQRVVWTGLFTPDLPGTHTTAAPRERMPLYVRAGAIIPAGPDVQWTGENPQGPLTLHVFAGADGSFTLYEDEGSDMGYTRGAFSRVPMRWDDAARTLTIGARAGSFPGMATERGLTVVLHDGRGAGEVFDRREGRSLTYRGEPLTLTF